jgi:PHP family Zn ribbon phosphoesterase
MTPSNIARMAALAGYSIISVSDHNTTGNCRSLIRAAQEAGIVAVPAMELTTSEEVHVLCLLPDPDAADEFGRYVFDRLPEISNRPEIFGEQILMDHDDTIIGYEQRLLHNATDISITDVPEIINGFGGIAIPAHIDRNSFSVLSNLGFLDPTLGFPAVEITRDCNIPNLVSKHAELAGMPYYINSDAHDLYSIQNAEFCLDLEETSAKEVIDVFRKGELFYMLTHRCQ